MRYTAYEASGRGLLTYGDILSLLQSGSKEITA